MSVAIAPVGSDEFCVVGFGGKESGVRSQGSGMRVFPLTDAGWWGWESERRAEMVLVNQRRRAEVSAEWGRYWERRHAWGREMIGQTGRLHHNGSIDEYVDARLAAEKRSPALPCDDFAFVRRIYLDVVGVTPTAEQVREFVADARADKRARLIDELLQQPGWADNWVGYWQDVLAENPNIVNPTLNNTGPFRWWIYEALLG